MGKIDTSEAAIAAEVRPWLERQGFACFGEVKLGTGRADLVGARPSAIVAVEIKASPSLVVLDQAASRARVPGVNAVWIAVPAPRRARKAVHAVPVFLRVCAALGFGLLLVRERARTEAAGAGVVVAAWPTWTRAPSGRAAAAIWAKSVVRIRARLSPEAAAQAGGVQGAHWTPFKGVVRDIVAWALAAATRAQQRQRIDGDGPPVELEIAALLEGVPSLVDYKRGHAYARRFFAWAVRDGLIPGCVIRLRRGRLVLVFDAADARRVVASRPADFPGVAPEPTKTPLP